MHNRDNGTAMPNNGAQPLEQQFEIESWPAHFEVLLTALQTLDGEPDAATLRLAIFEYLFEFSKQQIALTNGEGGYDLRFRLFRD